MADKEKPFRIDYYPAVAYADFTNLEAEEIAIIMQISNLNYIKLGPIDNDPAWIARSIKNMTRLRCEKIIRKLIGKNEISINPAGKLYKNRAEVELKSVRNRQESSSNAGKLGNDIRWGNQEKQSVSDRDPIETEIASTNTNTNTSKEERTLNLSLDNTDSSVGAPPPASTKKAAKNKKSGTRLTSDWELSEDDGNWCRSLGMPVNEILAEADKFKDYWTAKAGKNATKLDWSATWRNWIRNHLERKQERKSS